MNVGYRSLLASELILVRNQSKVTHIEWRLCPSQRDQNCPVPKSVSHSQFVKNIRIQIRKIGYYNVRLIKVSEDRPVYRSSAADKVGADSVENALSTLKHTFDRRFNEVLEPIQVRPERVVRADRHDGKTCFHLLVLSQMDLKGLTPLAALLVKCSQGLHQI